MESVREILSTLRDILAIVKRSETKLSHGFDAQGINITDKPLKDNVLNKIFIEVNEDTNECEIRILHEDVSIKELKSYLENKSGTFKIVSGDTVWKIVK